MICCTFPDCYREHSARGYCDAHWSQWRKGQPLKPIQRDQPRPPHTCTVHPPGTETCYRWDGCRCAECTYALSRERKRRSLPTRGLIEASGTRRRLQALAAIGHTLADLDRRLGYSPGRCSNTMRRRWVTPRVHHEIARLYDALWNVPGTSDITRKRAAANGWAVPLAWDDATIGDPDAQPATGTATVRTADETATEVEHLLRLGEAPAQIVRQLGYASPNSLAKVLYRARRNDLAQTIERKEAA